MSIINEDVGNTLEFLVGVVPGGAVREAPPDVSAETHSQVRWFSVDLGGEMGLFFFNQDAEEREAAVFAVLDRKGEAAVPMEGAPQVLYFFPRISNDEGIVDVPYVHSGLAAIFVDPLFRRFPCRS